MFCHRCGTSVDQNVQFCPNCGQAMGPSPISAANAVVPWTPPSQVHVSSGRWISAGWNLVMADIGTYLLITLLFFILSGVPFLGGPLIVGFHIVTMKKILGRNAQVGDFFQGFNFFVPALIASILIGIFVFLGTLALIIPGIIIAAMYKFTYLFILDKRMDFWQAMKASHAVVRNDYFGFTMFLILMFLVNVVGFLCLLVGLFVTVPLTFAAITVAYHEIVGFDARTVQAA